MESISFRYLGNIVTISTQLPNVLWKTLSVDVLFCSRYIRNHLVIEIMFSLYRIKILNIVTSEIVCPYGHLDNPNSKDDELRNI